MKGVFLVFEGIDGCGKTTQINHLSQWLPKSGLMPAGSKLLITREPGGTALGKSLRQLLLHQPSNQSPEPLAELLLYAADRAQHVSQLIIPSLEKGDWVISDRFSGSTLAYQGYGRKLNIKVIQELEIIATKNLVPDMTFWLDLTVQESLSRRKSKSNDRIEAEGSTFLSRVSSGFSQIAKDRNWIHLLAENSCDVIHKEIQMQITGFHAKQYLKKE